MVLGSLFSAVIGFSIGFGPRWVSYRLAHPHTKETKGGIVPGSRWAARDPAVLPPDPFTGWVVAHSIQHDRDSSTRKTAEPLVLERFMATRIEASVPEPLAALFGPDHLPLTSLAIRDAIGTLPLSERLECWAHIIMNAKVLEFPAVFHRAAREPLPESISHLLMDTVVAQWARLDPRAAFNAFRVPYPTVNGEYLGALDIVAGEWLKSEPATVLEEVDHLAFDYQRRDILDALLPNLTDRVEGLMRARQAGINQYLAMAVHFAQQLPSALLAASERDRDIVPVETIALAIGVIARIDTNTVLKEAKSFLEANGEDPYLKWLTALSIADGWADRSPQEALAWSREWCDSIGMNLTVRDPREVEAQVIRKWIENDPAAAASEAVAHFHYTRRLELMRLVGKHWRARDPEAAREWIENVPVGKAQEAALFGFLALDDEQVADLIRRYDDQKENGVPR